MTRCSVFMKILSRDIFLDKKELIINVESHPHEDLEPGIFMNSLTLWDEAFFPHFGSYLQKSWSDLHENFATEVSSDKERAGLRIRTPDAAPCWRVVPYWRDRRWRPTTTTELFANKTSMLIFIQAATARPTHIIAVATQTRTLSQPTSLRPQIGYNAGEDCRQLSLYANSKALVAYITLHITLH